MNLVWSGGQPVQSADSEAPPREGEEREKASKKTKEIRGIGQPPTAQQREREPNLPKG